MSGFERSADQGQAQRDGRVGPAYAAQREPFACQRESFRERFCSVLRPISRCPCSQEGEMRFSLIGCACAAALAAFALTGMGAVAADVQGQGCDLRGVKGSGCEPGTAVQPLRGVHFEPTPGTVVEKAHNGGGDKAHSTPTSPSPPVTAEFRNKNAPKPGGTDQPPPPHPQ
jgi:hypothetical protein